jgi:threonyl-tRNA synthetase
LSNPLRTTPSLIDRQRTLLRDLARLAADKAQAEPALAGRYRADVEVADLSLAQGRREAEQRTVALRRLGSQAQEVVSLDEAVRVLADEAAPPDLKR